MAGRRFVIIGALVLVLAVVALAIAVLPARQPTQSITLPGGSKITFAGTTYGKATIPPTGSWKRYFAFLPKPALKFLKIDPGWLVTVHSNHIILWFFAPQTTSAPMGVLYDPDVVLSLQDENGAECTCPNFPFASSGYKSPDGRPLQGFNLDAFPRRAKTFKLRIYSAEQDPSAERTLVGEFTIPNPAFRQYPDWQPVPLPVTRTDGDVAVTLTKFLTGVNFSRSKPATSNQESWVNTSFILTRNGKPCTDWQIDTIEFSDATGNSTHPSAWSNQQPKPNRETFSCRAPLWPSEKAWKLDVKFKHKDDATFASNEICIFAGIPLPEINAKTNMNLETNFNGVDMKIIGIQDETALLASESDNKHRQVKVYMRVGKIPDGLHLDTFESIRIIQNQYDSNKVLIAIYDLNYRLPASAKTIDVKAAIYRELTAQFIVKPTLVTASNSVSSDPK